MKLATFSPRGAGPRIGRVEGAEIIDLSQAGIPTEMSALLAAGPDALEKSRRAG
jgi:hypothetical protein